MMLSPLLRVAAGLLYVLSIIAFLVSLTFILLSVLVREDGGRQLASLINDNLSGATVNYTSADINFSLSGVHFNTSALTVDFGDNHLSADSADFWLEDDGVLKVALTAPAIHIGATGQDEPPPPQIGIPLELSAPEAHIVIAAASLTLANADVVLHADSDGWKLNVNKQRQLQLRAQGDNDQPIRLYAETQDFPLPAALAPPLVWAGARASLAAEIQDSIQYRAGGMFDSITSTDPRLTMNTVTWRSSGSCASLTQCMTAAAGKVRLRGQAPLPYRPAITITVSADGNWQRKNENWQLSLNHLQLAEGAATVNATLAITTDADLARLAVKGAIAAMPITTAQRYFPDGETQRWMATSLLGGEVAGARFALHTDSDFLPERTTVRVITAFRGGTLHIGEGWQRAEALQGTLYIRDDDIDIHGSGVFDGLAVTSVAAHIPTGSEKNTLFMDIRAAPAQLADYLSAARRTPATSRFMRQAEEELTLGNGRGQLSLTVTVPLLQPESSRASAHFAVQHADLQVEALPPYINIQGDVYFSNDGYHGSLLGRLENTPVDAERLQAVFDTSGVTVSGVADVSVLMSIAGIAQPLLFGSTPFALSRTAAATVFSASLDGTVIDLPYPLGKSARTTTALSVQISPDAVTARYTSRHVTINIQTAGSGVDIAINDASAAVPASGINLHGSADNVNLDLWLSQAGDENYHFSTIQLTLNQSKLMGISNDYFTVAGGGGGGATQPLSLQLDSSAIAGELVSAGKLLQGRFSRLSIPTGEDSPRPSDGSMIVSLTVALAAATLVVGDLTLGAMTLAGAPQGDSWKINQMQISNTNLTLDINGAYERQHTVLTVRLNVGELPSLLKVLQIPPVFGDGKVSLFGSIGWPGAPTDFSKRKMKGNLRLLGEQVQYLDVNLGTNVVNFLSIFSPQSLFSLGFTELGKGGGIIFDTVQGDIALEFGEADLTPINLVSRDLLMDIQGKTNFVYQRHNLHGRVRPGEKLLNAGSAVGLSTSLVVLNPASLVAGSLLGKIFEKPISEIGAYNYTITGPWKKPVYDEIGLTEALTDSNN